MLKFTQTVVANAAVTNSVAVSSTPSGAITLTASPVTFGSGATQLLTITSASNISNRTIVFVGTDVNGNAQTETVTGPNATTVTSGKAFKSVTSATISGLAAGALTIGNSATTQSPMYVPDAGSNPFSIGFGCTVVTGSPTFTVQHTFDDVQAAAYLPGTTTNTWFNHAVVAAQTATIDGNYAFPVTGIRLILTASGTVTMKLLQSGMGSR